MDAEKEKEAKKREADPNNLGIMEQIFNEGNRDSSFLHIYLNRLKEMQVITARYWMLISTS